MNTLPHYKSDSPPPLAYNKTLNEENSPSELYFSPPVNTLDNSSPSLPIMAARLQKPPTAPYATSSLVYFEL